MTDVFDANISHAFYYPTAAFDTAQAFASAVKASFPGVVEYDLRGTYPQAHIRDLQTAQRFLHGGAQTYDTCRFFLENLQPDLERAGFTDWCAMISYFPESNVMCVSFHYGLADICCDKLIVLRQSGQYRRYPFAQGERSCAELAEEICSRLGVRGAAVATVAAQLFATVLCLIFIYKKYELLHIGKTDFLFSGALVRDLASCGLSMGFMGCLVNIGSVALQTGINTLGNDIIVAHTAARKITELFMLLFGVIGTTMATYSGQNFGAGRFDRVKEGVRAALIIVFIWCGIVLLCSYTIAPALIRLVTGTDSETVISAATSYLKFDTLLYWVTAIIVVLRNTMQGIGDHVTPIISSSIECIGKIILVNLLVTPFGYWGIIVAEPITWCLMVIPLIVQYVRNPMLKIKKEVA